MQAQLHPKAKLFAVPDRLQLQAVAKVTAPQIPVRFIRSTAQPGRAMKPTIEIYTVAMPWYGREDFSRLWELAHDRDEMPSSYEVWHRNALAVVNAWLAWGRALEIVTIRPDEFLVWIGD